MPTRESCGKINLFLEITGKRNDGYHDLESIFLEIDLADRLSAEPAEAGVSLVCDAPNLSVGEDNLVVAAANALAEARGIRKGIRYVLRKRIPLGGGLGGGSSNAAAALRLANEIWEAGLSDAELARLGARLGSDVPFFLHGGTCLVEGRGERITPLPAFPNTAALVLVLSSIHSDTAAAFRGLRLGEGAERRSSADFLRAMRSGDVAAMADSAFNRFEETVFAALPGLAAIRARIRETTRVEARLSGSGSALWCFGDAADMDNRLAKDREFAELRDRYNLRIVPVRGR